MTEMMTKEDFLLSSVEWALRGMQSVGYMPLTISNNELKFKIFSWATFIPIFSIAALIFMSVHYEMGQGEVSIVDFDHTEYIVIAMSGSISTLASIGLKLANLKGWKKILKFWNTNLSIITEFGNKGIDVSEHGKIFLKIQRSIKNSVLIVLVVTISLGSLGLGIGLIEVWNGGYILKYRYKPSTQGFLVTSIWFLYLMFHAFHAVWISFFIQFYTGCFTIIRDEILKAMPKPNEETKIYFVVDSTKRQYFQQKLKNCIQMFYQVEQQVEYFNQNFGTHLLFECAFSILQVIIFAFFGISWAYYNGLQAGHISHLIPIILFPRSLYALGSNSNELMVEAKSVMMALEKNIKFVQDETLKSMIQFIGIRVYRKPPMITANNYFTLSRQLLTSIFSAITTYLVILLQFRGSEHPAKDG